MMAPLRIELRASRQVAFILCVVHAVAAAALWVSPLPLSACCAASVLLAWSAAWNVRRHAFRTAAEALVALELYEDCTLSARSADGRWLRFAIAGTSFVTPGLTILNMRAEGRWRLRSVLITKDSIDRDAFRRLRVWLRWYCASRMAVAQEV